MQTVISPQAAQPTGTPPGGMPPGTQPGAAQTPRRFPRLLVWPEDGVITVLLLCLSVYITIASIQAVNPPWAPGMSILTPLTLLGLALGLLAVQQRALPTFVVHLLALVIGCVVAFWQTAVAVLGGDKGLLWAHLSTWLYRVLHNKSNDDASIFLLFLGVLSYLLAYLCFWLVIHSRRPWLAVLACGVVLLINLDFASPDELIFLVLFLLAALLLLVRFTLAENMRHWRFRRLRFSPDLSWDFLQAGAIFAVVVLLLAYMLPAGAPNAAITGFLNNPQGAWQQLQARWSDLFGSLNGPGNGGTVSFFSTNLQLRGTITLPDVELFRYVSNDPAQYLVTQTYDTYDGHASWTNSLTQAQDYAPNAVLPAPSNAVTTINQTVYLTNIGGGQRSLFAAAEPASFDIATELSLTTDGGMPTQWESQRGLVNGDKYAATSYISTASTDQLRAVAAPANAQPGVYPQVVLDRDLNSAATTISPQVATLAQQWTAGATNPYDQMAAIEAHLQHEFTYSLSNGEVPSNEDAVVWFLKNKKGFCTFFASTMALMARSLGMPARIASGVSTGTYDASQRNYVIKGLQLHVWPQIYFAGYGWINFEPTASYNLFQRGTGTNGGAGATVTAQSTGGANGRPTATPKNRQINDPNLGTSAPSPATTALRDVGLTIAFLVTLLLLILVAFVVWWRALYRGLPPIGAAFARMSRLGTWSGSPPRRDQTPYEYAEALGHVVPGDAATLNRLSDLYVRDRWGGVAAPEGESRSLYQRVQLALARAILQRWRTIPAYLLARLQRSVANLGWLQTALHRPAQWFARLFEPPEWR